MKKEPVIQQVIAAIISVLLVLLLGYSELRAGEKILSAFNLGLAASALFILGFVLLLGPLTRLFSVFSRIFVLRKEFGIMAFFLALTHVYLAMFPLAWNGPWGLYRSLPFSAYPGLEALVIMFLLVALSFDLPVRVLGPKIWWAIQYWGARATFLLISIHMIVLRFPEISLWIDPSKPKPAGVPPLYVWETLFIVNVLLIRISELFGKTLARIIAVGVIAEAVGTVAWVLYFR